MKTYIKVWAIILLIVDIFVFGFFLDNRGKIITRNQEFEKVFPCNTNNVVLSAIELEGDGTVSRPAEADITPEPRKEPFIRRADNSDSDLPYIFEAIVIIDVVLSGIAFLIYKIQDNLRFNRPDLSLAFSSLLIALLIGSGFTFYFFYQYVSQPGKVVGEVHYNAPIIYLYDDLEREATVKLDLNGQLTCTYPKYNEETGWIVKTSSNGVLTDRNGRQYEYLYWEADVDMDPDLSKGFCVRGEDSAAFLEKALADLGLTDIEANAFIMYWLPQLEANPYNIVTFQTESYEAVAKLDVDPLPDTVVRVNMLFCGSDEYVEMEEQDLSEMNPSVSEREGFVLVEWGGGKLE